MVDGVAVLGLGSEDGRPRVEVGPAVSGRGRGSGEGRRCTLWLLVVVDLGGASCTAISNLCSCP